MGVTGVIDRGETVRDRSVEQGMEVEIIASDEQCGSEILFYGIGILDPAANTGLHVHDDIEIAWFMLEGDTYCVMGSSRGGRFRDRGMPSELGRLCRPRRTPPACQSKQSEPAVILMAYVGTQHARRGARSFHGSPEALSICSKPKESPFRTRQPVLRIVRRIERKRRELCQGRRGTRWAIETTQRRAVERGSLRALLHSPCSLRPVPEPKKGEAQRRPQSRRHNRRHRPGTQPDEPVEFTVWFTQEEGTPSFDPFTAEYPNITVTSTSSPRMTLSSSCCGCRMLESNYQM